MNKLNIMAKMKYYQIDINGKTFPYQEVFLESAGGNVLIGPSSLLSELVNEDRSYKSDYAMKIDEKFYGFVDDDLFETLAFDEFTDYVNSSFD